MVINEGSGGQPSLLGLLREFNTLDLICGTLVSQIFPVGRSRLFSTISSDDHGDSRQR